MNEKAISRDAMNIVFSNGTAKDLSIDDLQKYLDSLCSGYTDNNGKTLSEDINRGITINYIQMGRLIEKVNKTMIDLNESNCKTQESIKQLTGLAIIIGIGSMILSAMIFCYNLN